MVTLAFAAIAVSGWAHAAGTVSAAQETSNNIRAQQWSPSRNTNPPKTRAQVRQELIEAERDGQLAQLNSTLYRGGT